MFSKLRKTFTFGLVALLLSLSLAPALALAHGGHDGGPEDSTTTCRLRATVEPSEFTGLTGTENTGATHETGDILVVEETTQTTEKMAGDHGLVCTYGLVKFVTNLLFFVLIAIAVFFIALAAFLFVTAGGNPDKAAKARTYLIYAVAGLAVAAVARAIPAVVRGIIGV